MANTAAGVAPLRLQSKTTPATDTGLTSGDLANFDGNLFYTAGSSGGVLAGFVYTEFTASQVVPITPNRILDTRTGAGRSHISNASGNLDSASRLLAATQLWSAWPP